MSGYGGRPPSEWQDPYGQSSYGHNPYGPNPAGQDPYRPYGQDPYAQDPYGPQPTRQDPWALPESRPASNAAAVAAIVGNSVGLLFVCGIGIAWLPGLILGGVAVNKIQSNPAAARSLTRYSWICCGLNFLIEAMIFVVWYVTR
jgi:hypothetical protein